MPDDEVAHDAVAETGATRSHDDELPEDAGPHGRSDDVLPEDGEPDGWPGDDLLPEDATPPAPAGPPRRKSGGSIVGAAMMGLQQAMFGKPHEEAVIEVETSGDPPNIDRDGLDEQFTDDSRLVGPPLDEIKARRRPVRPSRSSRRRR